MVLVLVALLHVLAVVSFALTRHPNAQKLPERFNGRARMARFELSEEPRATGADEQVAQRTLNARFAGKGNCGGGESYGRATASYSMARRAILEGAVPPPTNVRVEEMINYFRYDYEPPHGERELFSIQADGARSPVDDTKYLLRIGIQAKVVEPPERLDVNLVFLVDTSWSMMGQNRIGLAKRAMEIAVDQLSARDRVAIATYAGRSQLLLEPTPGDRKATILRAVRSLETGGGTAMEAGMVLAYEQAMRMRREGAITRVIVLSDGDANIGATTHSEILATIAEFVKEGVTLSTVGFGRSNYRDAMMERLADDGNGNYFYVDSPRMAERVFQRDFLEIIQDVAQDVKIQVELDPGVVRAYRLVGYDRGIADVDFRDDGIDAGEIGAGGQVTALYELTMKARTATTLGTVRVRAKRPGGGAAKEATLVVPVAVIDRPFSQAPDDFRLAAAVMGIAELLRRSPAAKDWSIHRVLSILDDVGDADPDRRELALLVERLSGYDLSRGATRARGSNRRDINISAGTPMTYGSMSKEGILRVIRQHIAQIRYCYEKELVRTPGLFGKVDSRFTISASGWVERAEVSHSTIGSGEVERCIISKIRTWRFPKPKGGGIVIVKYPFIFKTSG